MTTLLTNGSRQSPLSLVLAHGAGAAMDTPFMQAIAEGVAQCGWQVVRFEFPYMHQRREDGKKRPPNAMQLLCQSFNQVIEQLGGPNRLVIGGKSMGGRVASLVAVEMLAAEDAVPGLICLGYPFHPAGKAEKLRVEHLKMLATPTLICQGERDALGSREEVQSYGLPDLIEFEWLADGDHSFKPRKRSGHTLEQNLAQAIEAIDNFLRKLAISVS